MPDMLSPNVYVTEVDYSAYVQARSTSAFGIVGVFQKGPVGSATLVTSLEEAKQKFGDYLDSYFGMHSLKNFFENGGARAWVVRTTHYTAGASTATPATVNLNDRHATTPAATLKVDGVTPGTWAAGIQITIAASDAYPSTGFNLTVKNSAGTVLETFKDLLIGSANAASADYVEKRINGKSNYVKVTDLLSATAAENNRPAVATSSLTGGNDGLSGIVPADFVGSSADGNGLYALDNADVGFVAIPGEANVAGAADDLANGLIAYCESRKDCVAIIEAPQGATVSGLVDFRKGTGSYSHSAFNSSYGALYGPWLKGTHPTTSREITLPPAGFVAGVYARNDAEGAVWTAPAGLQRGTLRGATDTEIRITKGSMDTLYSAGVNALGPVVGTLAVYGQKTLQLKASATDRVAVRRLLALVEKSVSDSAQSLVFEPNNKQTWERFKRLVNPFLQRIKDKGGLYDFAVICDESVNTASDIDAGIMNARILLKPTKAAEFVSIEFAIAPTGADFSEL